MAAENNRSAQPLRLRIAIAARTAGKPQYVLEKDYALSYLLAGIAAVPALREGLVFKLEEVATEKLRAFLQSRQHLQERGWLRNRPRDLYDLWRLWQQNHLTIDWLEVGRLLAPKAAAYGLEFSGPADFLDDRVLQGIRRDWQAQLADFVTDLPSFEECITALPDILDATLA
ncbi:MAG: nucleotidyl transferase AbiEii/AbiGii toxin family protein [Dehalococcoidia bacterium]|nr:nucleotidyl transferase AbiEii/AbiGii toxin family protein [Dehalococcoidia bacterium]